MIRPALLAVALVTAQPEPFDSQQWVYPAAQPQSVGIGRAGGGAATNPHVVESVRGTWRTRASYSDVVKFYEKRSGLSLPIGGRGSRGHNEDFVSEDSELRPVSLRILTKRLADNTQVTVVISRADGEAWTHITMFARREVVPR